MTIGMEMSGAEQRFTLAEGADERFDKRRRTCANRFHRRTECNSTHRDEDNEDERRTIL